MTVVKSVHGGKVIPLPRPELGRADAGDAFAPPAPSNFNGLQNVVPFLRPRTAEAQAPAVALPGDVLRPAPARLLRERARLAGFAALSLLVHAAVFAAFWRDPEPLAGINVEAISAEIVIGASAPAGVSPMPGEQQVNAAAADAEQKPEERAPEAQQPTTEQPQSVQIASQETMPEEKIEQPMTEAKAAEPEPSQPAEQKPAVAMVESPTPDTATAAPRELPPDTTELSLLPQPDKSLEPKSEPKTEAKSEAKPVAKPVPAAPPKPVKNAAPAKERRRIEAPTRDQPSKQAKASTPSTAANGVGIGRSDANSNYPGIVRAHLARYQQSLGSSQGTAVVSFTLAGSGAVGGVRLARASGVAAIDQEVQAMVRRASPFPPPPAGATRDFTIPIKFRQD